MLLSEIRRKFFYAMHEAGMYDATIEFVVPLYEQMHSMMQRLAKDHVPHLRDKVALDIGAGTGVDSIMLLESIPDLRIIGVDLCEPMVDLFNKKAADAGITPERFAVFVADALDDSTYARARVHASDRFGKAAFGLVFSAFTIHHFAADEKLFVIQRIYDLLTPGGIFILGDLFNCSGESSWMTDTILDFEVKWMHENFTRAIEAAKDSKHVMNLEALRDNWIQHYLTDNRLSSVSEHFEMLRHVGFSEVANPLRYYQVGVVWARK
ncbi:MAG: class I SAM-dependent methyltransferase [Pirellulaceae bacterium]|nr:class I SAM-dependent methyltransferase [Pirellulaceae bacterium]